MLFESALKHIIQIGRIQDLLKGGPKGRMSRDRLDPPVGPGQSPSGGPGG